MSLADDGDAPCRGTIAPQGDRETVSQVTPGIDVYAGFKSDVVNRSGKPSERTSDLEDRPDWCGRLSARGERRSSHGHSYRGNPCEGSKSTCRNNVK